MARRIGLMSNLLAIACVAVAAVKHETADISLFGALDRNPIVIGEPNITPWLVAAIVLVAIGTVLLLRRG